MIGVCLKIFLFICAAAVIAFFVIYFWLECKYNKAPELTNEVNDIIGELTPLEQKLENLKANRDIASFRSIRK